MNFQLSGAKMLNVAAFESCSDLMFIRGNTIRYVHLNQSEVDVEPLSQACKKQFKQKV
jgi:hypothetical protein